jgi:hypothetical protein
MDTGEGIVFDNLYVAVVGRKQRNLKKKLEKIAKAEQQLAAGKTLDEEQNVLLKTKPQVERLLAELQAIKLQLVDAAKQEAQKQQPRQSQGSSAIAGSNGNNNNHTANGGSPNARNDPHHPAASASNSSHGVPHAFNPMAQDKLITTKVHKLVKLLHVYEQYTSLSGGKVLPEAVDKMGKLLLGRPQNQTTTVGRADEVLSLASKAADTYLNVSSIIVPLRTVHSFLLCSAPLCLTSFTLTSFSVSLHFIAGHAGAEDGGACWLQLQRPVQAGGRADFGDAGHAALAAAHAHSLGAA